MATFREKNYRKLMLKALTSYGDSRTASRRPNDQALILLLDSIAASLMAAIVIALKGEEE